MKPVKHFDMHKKPKKELYLLTPLAYLLSFPTVWKRKLKVNKVNMDDCRPPYILLCTHHAFIDFKVTTKAIFPHRANYIVAIDGFIKREWLLRHVGAICKRKFTSDPLMFRHVKYSLEHLKQIVAIYPEARYTIVGTQSVLPESLGKMIKVLKHPVVVLNMHGNYLSQPQWNLRQRKVNLTADMTQIIKKDEIHQLSVEAINERINQAFVYDEYRYQKAHDIHITEPFRAEGLERVLYQCPECHTAFQMKSNGAELSCQSCKKTYVLETNGSLRATDGKTTFDHIPDWFEHLKDNVRKEIEDGTYYFHDDVMIESLPNAKGFIPLGQGKLTHDKHGFLLEWVEDGVPKKLMKEPLSLYGLHIEYNYMKKGDCIDLSTLDDTYYIYPINHKNVVTKLYFATEILYERAYKDLKSTD
ncbi:MAG: hypothetical protein ACNA7K_05435 [Acholeplasmataceae bacterium]